MLEGYQGHWISPKLVCHFPSFSAEKTDQHRNPRAFPHTASQQVFWQAALKAGCRPARSLELSREVSGLPYSWDIVFLSKKSGGQQESLGKVMADVSWSATPGRLSPLFDRPLAPCWPPSWQQAGCTESLAPCPSTWQIAEEHVAFWRYCNVPAWKTFLCFQNKSTKDFFASTKNLKYNIWLFFFFFFSVLITRKILQTFPFWFLACPPGPT